MRSRVLFALFWYIGVVSALPAAAQQSQPKAIQFKGVPEYAEKDLLAASGLQPGVMLSADDMNAHMKRLADTGLFEQVGYNFDGANLIVNLTPSPQLYSVKLANIPLAPQTDLDSVLQSRLPLYRGKVPSEGGLLESVRGALEQMLAAQGIKATVVAAPYTDDKLHKVTAMTFDETSPPVAIGEIAADASSTPLDPKATALIEKLSGTAYDVEGSPSEIETNLDNYYQDQGYLEAQAHAARQGAAVVAADGVKVPFTVSVTLGALYKITAVQLAPGTLVTQADFDKQSHIHPGDVADGERVRENWHYLARQYHNRGYIEARIHVTPSFDRAQGTVSYAVSADAGPQFMMGTLTIENVTDDLRGAMYSAWKMPQGAVFNEGAILGFFATNGVNPKLEQMFKTSDIKYTLKQNEDNHTVDVVLRLEKKH